jgi:flagella basal body P-ring formation protein FlgA
MKYASLRRPRPGLVTFTGEAGERLVRSLLGAAGLAILASVLLAVIAPAPARSGETSALRASVSVTADVVTVGDFFENAGSLAERPLFRAPDLGTTGPVSAAGLAGAEAGGLVEVSVARLARSVESAEIARLIAQEALRRPGFAADTSVEDIEVVFDGPVAPYAADLRSREPIRIVSLSVSPQNGRFDALVQIDQGERNDRAHLRGTLTETVSVTVLNRSLSRGDLVSAEDVRVDRQPRNRAVGRIAVVEPSEIVGRQARRSLRAGQVIAAADFARPQVVARGETVTVVFRAKSLRVTTRGQALSAAAVGDTVSVLNPQSKRTLQGTVAAPGLVEIVAAPAAVALAKADQ